MENAADALKIAFAVFVFVIAITVLFSMVSQAKSTADTVLFYNDETNFYEHTESSDVNPTVTVSDVISTLYRYYNESICVTVNLLNSGPRTFDLGSSNISYSNKSAIESDLQNYIKENLLVLEENTQFTKTFDEVITGGIYVTGEDGTEVILSSGEKKIYITYTQN